jgi:hypothetical protein
MLVLEIYIFQAVKIVLPATQPRLRLTIFVIYWIISILLLVSLLSFPYLYETFPKQLRSYLLAIIVGAFFSMLIASLFLALDDIRRGATWVIIRLFRNAEGTNGGAEGITRSAFLSWLGIGLGGGLFTTLVYGFSNKYNYTIRRQRLSYSNLPEAFKGLRIVHISDIHSGSFMDKIAVLRGIDKIMKENPDIILFTGDLVNDRAIEMIEYMDVFNRLKAPMGVYSTLGNHDYGDYARWASREDKAANL